MDIDSLEQLNGRAGVCYSKSAVCCRIAAALRKSGPRVYVIPTLEPRAHE